MTLAELADLFLRLGAREAINLDGGGSSAMVIRGQVINRPSDASGERAVGNALLLDRCEPPSP
jgi:exopolysaccharide biosynthesis protein